MPRVEVATPPPDPTFLDEVDQNGAFAVSNPASIQFRTAGRMLAFPATSSGQLLNANTGTVATVVLFGRQWSGATTTAIAGFRGQGAAAGVTRVPLWPLGLDWTGLPVSARTPNLRYRYSVCLRRAMPLVDVAGTFGTAIVFSAVGGNALLTQQAASVVGIEVSSSGAVNGGNWTCWWRTTSGGALNQFDSGILPDGNFQGIGYYYDTGPSILTFTIADNPVLGLTAAQVPQPTTVAGVPAQIFGVAQYSGGVAGQTDAWGLARMSLLVLA